MMTHSIKKIFISIGILRMALVFLAGVSSVAQAQAQDQLSCETLKLSPKFFKNLTFEPKTDWTEEEAYFNLPGVSPDYQLRIIDQILAYQNDRMIGCGQVKPRIVSKLYSNKRMTDSSTLKVAIAIGYNDVALNKFIWDDFIYKIFLTKFLSTCESPSHGNCGFKLVQQDQQQSILTKRIWGGKTLELQIYKASLTTDDEINRKDPRQIELSLRTQKKYHDSFADSQFVFYVGHSRNGGGPDFSPARLLPNQHPDYMGYQKAKINTSKMMKALVNIPAENRPLVFGILGCSSGLHYKTSLRSALPESGLLLSKQAVYSIELFEGILAFVNGIQWKKSAEEMNIDLNAINIGHRRNGTEEMSLLYFDAPTN